MLLSPIVLAIKFSLPNKSFCPQIVGEFIHVPTCNSICDVSHVMNESRRGPGIIYHVSDVKGREGREF